MTIADMYQSYINDLRSKTKKGELSSAERSTIAGQISEGYLEVFDAMKAVRDAKNEKITLPDTSILDQLADLVLYDDLTDATPYKIANTEYPFMNARMMERRKARDVKVKTIETEQERKLGGYRRLRSPHEHSVINREVKTRNKERKKRYNDFVNGKIDGILSVNIESGEVTRFER